MSITQITREFLGLSSDTKPTNVATGSKFIELDTKKVFIFDGSSWYLNPMPVMVTDSLPTGSNIIGKVGIDFGNNGVSIVGSLYKDLALAVEGINMAAGATVWGNYIDNVQWVRNMIIMYSSDQAFDIYLGRRNMSGNSDANGWITGLSAGANTRCMSTANNSNQTALLGYSARFGVKNTAAVANTYARAYIQLMGL